MKVIFVTANLPFGTDEAFIVPEISQLIRAGHEVLIVPRSPKGRVIHGKDLTQHTRCEPLCSPAILTSAARIASTSPIQSLQALRLVAKSRTPGVAAKNLAVIPKAFWLAGLAQEWGAEHLHAHWASTTATMAMIAGMVSGIPWSFTAHRWDVVENNLLRKKVTHARMARFISEDGLRMAKEIGIGPAPNARVLVMGVDVPAQVERRSGTWPLLVCPARLVEVKGHRFLLKAWKILRERGVHGELWLAGDGELRPQLESCVRAYGLQHCVKFLGTLAHQDLLKIYREAPVSAVVLASDDLGGGVHEGIPVALVEAMSFGIPVVATDAGGTSELVKPGTGLLVPPADAVALADAIQRLLEDKALLQQLGAGARQHVMETRNIVEITSELASILAGETALPKRNVSAAA
jgi:colanic acid/amylovoran biosynthesis glycosyltransferase